MPFVDRDYSLATACQELVDNMSSTINNPPRSLLKNISLVCAGHHYGMGKTVLGENMPRKIETILKEEPYFSAATVISVAVEVNNDIDSFWNLWRHHIVRQPGMDKLLDEISEDMHLLDLLRVTSAFLHKTNKVLFLHFDEFGENDPKVQKLFMKTSLYNELGELRSSQELFYDMWKSTLTHFMFSPRVMLYVSGKSAVYDTIGVGGLSPTKVFRPPMKLLSVDHVHEIISLFDVFQTGSEPRSLESVLLELLIAPETCTKAEALDQIVNGIHRLSGGIPRYIEHALLEVLTLPAVSRYLFDSANHKDSVQLATILSVLGVDGTALKSRRFGATVGSLEGQIVNSLQAISAQQRMRFNTDLLRLFLASGQLLPCKQVEYQSCVLLPTSSIAQLLRAAQFWGVHHSFESKTQEPKQEGVRFVMPEATRGMLQRFRDTALQQLNTQWSAVATTDSDQSGAANENGAVLSLVLDRISLTVEDGLPCMLEAIMQRYLARSGVFKKICGDNAAVEAVHSTAHVTYLPTVRADGKATLESVQAFNPASNSGAIGEKQALCSFKTLVQRLGGSNQVLQTYKLGARSATADVIVRHRHFWLHFQLQRSKEMNALEEVWSILHNVAKLAPSDSHHVLVFQNTGGVSESLCTLRDDLRATASCAAEINAINAAFAGFAVVETAVESKCGPQLSETAETCQKTKTKMLKDVLKVLVSRRGYVGVIALDQKDSVNLAENGMKILQFEPFTFLRKGKE